MASPFRNVLFLCQRVPFPPDRGDRISTHHLLGHFLAGGARVRIGCFAEDARDLESVRTLRARVTDVCAPRIHPGRRKLWSLRGLVTGQPLTLPYYGHRALFAAVRRWQREDPADLVFMYSSSMGQYVLDASGPVRVMHFAELDSDKWRQYAAQSGPAGRFVYGREATKLLEFERRVAATFDASLVVSDVERELFARQIPGATAHVLPNGVDVDHFTSRGDGAREPHGVVFTGVMDYEPNVDGVCWFAESCWPAIRRALPDATFRIVGNRPVARVRELDGRDGIEVTGWVEATPPYFDRARVAIAPLRLARGLQNKVLEAMSMGLPVVATPQAAQGITGAGADTLPVAADADGITRIVLELLRDPARAQAVGARAASFVRAHFRWETVFARLDAILAELAG